MGFWIEATREIFTSVIFKTHQFQILELSIKYIKKSMIQISESNQKKHYFYCSY